MSTTPTATFAAALQPGDGGAGAGAERGGADGAEQELGHAGKGRAAARGQRRRGAAARADRAAPALHRQHARARDPRRLGGAARRKFVKVFPHEYRRALSRDAREAGDAQDRARRAEDARGRLHGQDHRFHRVAAHPGGRCCPSPSASSHYREFIARARRRGGGEAGRALHGLRHPVLPDRLSGQQHHSRLERPRVPQASGAQALDVLHSTNNFPEFTGRVCPAPCEAACTLNINNDPVGIKSIEHFIIDKGWEEGWVVAAAAAGQDRQARRRRRLGARRAWRARSSSRAPATMSSLFEKSDRIGGLLRYGIPDFKMEKHLIDRRIEQMSIEGVEFRPNVHVGVDVAGAQAAREFDAIVLTGGAEKPRDLAGAGPRAGRHPLRDGLPAAAEQDRRRRRGRRTDPRDRQARRRHRRRRHRLRLRRHVEPPGRGVGHAVRAAAAAARTREQAARRGRTGRSSCARRRRTRKAASATGRSRPSASRAGTARSRSSSPRASNGRRTTTAA